MKKRYTLLFSLLFYFTCIFSQTNTYNLHHSKELPSVNIKNIEGNIVNTSSISNNGKPIIIDFWTTYCIPCIRELNILNKYYDEWKSKTGVKIYIISLDKTENITKVQQIMIDNNWEFILLHDPDNIFKDTMNVNGIPCTFVIDKERNIYFKHIGFYPGDEKDIFEELVQIYTNN
ncbi:MAG: TlpA disulfide reductase family protein [Bacteroidota bacterium]|nr:TlpA disulfide reductase family protein [Bacteroidota bacterium]